MVTPTIASEATEEFGYRLKKELTGLGVEYFAYFVTHKKGSDHPLVISNYPSQWLDHYSRNRLYREDPVLTYGLQRVAPYSWSEALGDDRRSNQDEVFRLSKTFDIETGFSFPLHDPNNRFAALSLCNRSNDPDFGRIIAQSMNSLMILFLKTHEALTNILPTVPQPTKEIAYFENNKVCFQLTKREIDVLRWASQGKTYPEISIILGISVRTVKFHIENIVKKLDVSNAKHAIFKAKHYDLL